MRKYFLIIISVSLVACASSTDDSESVDISTTTLSEVSTTVTSASSESTTSTQPVISYEFNIEKMSPFTGIELQAETWLKRPRRVIAFKIDNNINARPQ